MPARNVSGPHNHLEIESFVGEVVSFRLTSPSDLHGDSGQRGVLVEQGGQDRAPAFRARDSTVPRLASQLQLD